MSSVILHVIGRIGVVLHCLGLFVSRSVLTRKLDAAT